MVAAFGLVVALDLPDGQGRDGRFVAVRGADLKRPPDCRMERSGQ